MSSQNSRSLRNILFTHEIAFLLLVAVTGILGGLSAYFWQQTSKESVRIYEERTGAKMHHMPLEISTLYHPSPNSTNINIIMTQ